MERCTLCGSDLPRDAQFCGSCGRLVKSMHAYSSHPLGSPAYQTVQMAVEDDGPTVITRPSNPQISLSNLNDATIRHTWSDRETPTHHLPPLSNENDEDASDEEEERRDLLFGLPLPGGFVQRPPASVPMVQGLPQIGSVPMVPGNGVLPGATSAAQGLLNAASTASSPFSTPSAPTVPVTPRSGSWTPPPTHTTPSGGTTHHPPTGTGTGTGSGSSGSPGTGNPGGSGCGLTMLLVSVIVLIIIATLGGLFFGLPPAISLVGSSNVTSGSMLHLHGDHFVPGSSITLTLDNSIPLFATTYSPAVAHSQHGSTLITALSPSLLHAIASSTTPLRAGATGSFDITLPVSTSWTLGRHTIRATESIGSRSTALAFTVDTAPAKLLVKPTTLDFGKLEVGSKAILSIVVNNSGQQALNWQTSASNVSWLSPQPASGAVQANAAPQFIYVTGDASQLKVGQYTATLQITSNGGTAQVSVRLEVVPQSVKPTAKLSVTPTTLDFGSLDSGTQLTHSLTVGNTGTAALKWTASTGNANWVKLDSTSQTIQPGAKPNTVNVTVDTTNLSPGSQTATITITSNGGTAQIAITVVVNVSQQPCALQAPSSSSLTFNANLGANPAPQNVTVSVTGNCTNGVTVTPTVAIVSGSGWLAVAPSSATITSGSATFSVNVTASALSPGTYTGSISFAALSNGSAISGSPQTTNVSLTVTEVPPVLSVSPGNIPVTLSNSDSATTYAITIANTGGASLNWNATLDPNTPSFVTLSSGNNTTVAAGASTTLHVNVNPANQQAGTYSTTVTVTAVDPYTGKTISGSPATVSISITINAAPSMQLSTTSLTFTPGNCVYTASSPVTISNVGGGTLNWNVAAPVYNSGSGWLTVSPSGNGTGNTTLTFAIDGRQLVNGQIYTATVTITPSVGNAQTVSVSFTVPYCIQ